MRELEFSAWLSTRMAPNSVDSRVRNCRRIEEYEGDLDSAFRRDQLRSLQGRLEFSKADQLAARPPHHRIPIAGNVYDGTATLRAALNLYRQFCLESVSVHGVMPMLAPSRKSDVPNSAESVASRFRDVGTRELLGTFSEVLDELRARQVMRTSNNPVADFAEYLVSKALGLRLVSNSTAGHDALDESGRRIEIKARRVGKGHKSVQLSAIRGLDSRKFDVLAAVLFSPRFDVEKACLIPFDVVKSEARYVQHVNAWNLIVRPSLWNATGVEDITKVLKQVVL